MNMLHLYYRFLCVIAISFSLTLKVSGLKICQAGNQLMDSGKLTWVQYDPPTPCDVILPGGFRSFYAKDRHVRILLRNPFGQKKFSNDLYCLQRSYSPSTPTLFMSPTTSTTQTLPALTSSPTPPTVPASPEESDLRNEANMSRFPETEKTHDFQDDITAGYTLRNQETISSTTITSRIFHDGSTYGESISSSTSDTKTTVRTSSVESSTPHFYFQYKTTLTFALTEHKVENSSPENTKDSARKTWTTNVNHSIVRPTPQVYPIYPSATTTSGPSSSKTTRTTLESDDNSPFDLFGTVQPPTDLANVDHSDYVCTSTTKVNGTQYCFIEELRTWKDSDEVCRSLAFNSHLVYIDSEAENEFVTSFAKQGRVGIHNDVWTGLNDIQTEGQWHWDDTDEEVKYFNWCEKWNDPNNGGFNTWEEDCAFFSIEFEGSWFDDRCSSLHSTMCETHDLLP